MYDIVVADARAPRDGRFIEKLGIYNPNTDPATIELNTDSALNWVMNGAQPSDTARAILSYKGVMLRKHLQVGVNKGAITQEEADKRFAAWLKEKEAKIQAKVDTLAKDKAAADKSKLAAETKVKEARAEALLKKQSEMLAAAEAAAKAESGEEGATGEEEAGAPAAATEEAPAPAEAAAPEAKEEAPAEEDKAEAETPAAEATETAEAAPEAKEAAKEETPAEPKAEEPAAEAKAEAPAAKEEAPATEEAAGPAEKEEKKEE